MYKVKNFLIVIVLLLLVSLVIGLIFGFVSGKFKLPGQSPIPDNSVITADTFIIKKDDNKVASNSSFSVAVDSDLVFDTNSDDIFISVHVDNDNTFDFNLDDNICSFTENQDVTNGFTIVKTNKSFSIKYYSILDFLAKLYPNKSISIDESFYDADYSFKVFVKNNKNEVLSSFGLVVRLDKVLGLEINPSDIDF